MCIDYLIYEFPIGNQVSKKGFYRKIMMWVIFIKTGSAL